jgi:ADP-ribosylglycohydrolase
VARAMLLFERQADASLLPTTVILATPKRLDGRALPGSPNRDARLSSILQNALPPRINDLTEERGTFEDWIGWAINHLANGMTTWATEIKPEGTVDTLYEREVANVVASLPRPQAIEPDPVGEASGIELVEITEGVILSVERETDRRLYGVFTATDGDPVDFVAVQTSLRKDRILRRTPLSLATHPMRGPDGSSLLFEGYHGWHLGTPTAGPGSPEAIALQRYPVPKLEWPEAKSQYRNLIVLRDRFMGSLIGGAIGDGLGGPVDGLSRAKVRVRLGPLGVQDLPPEGARGSDATQLSVEVARSLAEHGGHFDPADFAGRLVAWQPIGHGVGPATHAAAAALANGEPWYEVGTRVDSSDNGAAVRSGPIGLVHSGETSATALLREAVRFALPTHGGKVGVAAAVAVAAAVGYLARLASTGSTTFEVGAFLDFVATAIGEIEVEPTPTRRPPVRSIYLRDRIRRIETWLDRTPEAVFDRVWTGDLALESVPAAIFCFLRTPDRPRDALLTAANASHETAAIGSITGNLVGAWVGADRLRDELPRWWAAAERLEELLALSDLLIDTSADLAEGEDPPLTLLG